MWGWIALGYVLWASGRWADRVFFNNWFADKPFNFCALVYGLTFILLIKIFTSYHFAS